MNSHRIVLEIHPAMRELIKRLALAWDIPQVHVIQRLVFDKFNTMDAEEMAGLGCGEVFEEYVASMRKSAVIDNRGKAFNPFRSPKNAKNNSDMCDA